jgi:alkylated DNA repair dioxygenase AlkB
MYAALDGSATAFRTAEKLFRRGGALPDLRSILAAGALDFSAARAGSGLTCLQPPPPPPPPPPPLSAAPAGAASLRTFSARGGVFSLPAYPGFYVLPRALSVAQQEALARAALRRYVEPPSRRSLDRADGGGGGAPPPLWRGADGRLQRRLGWATLGLHYDWAGRRYHIPGEPAAAAWASPFPPLLASFCEAAVACAHAAVERAGLGSAPAPAGLPLAPFSPQSAILSVYHAARARADKLPMGGHKDDIERTMAAPVLSVSLGATAVFLLGGDERDAPPQPLLLRSGDVTLLSGAVRACVHGVPRVLVGEGEGGAPLEPLFCGGGGGAAAAAPAERGGSCEEDACEPGGAEEEAAFRDFMAAARLNFTVRQIY